MTMSRRNLRSTHTRTITTGVAAGLATLLSCHLAAANNTGGTATPIKHVIILIGENRSLDNIYATYEPKDGQSIAKSGPSRSPQCDKLYCARGRTMSVEGGTSDSNSSFLSPTL
jgi:phospholipase C